MTDLEQELLKAVKAAYRRSCERAESRVKWTMKDQAAHEALVRALTVAERSS